MKRILITGATGYIGKYLSKFLENSEYEIILAGRNIKMLNKIYPGRNVISYENLNDLQNIDIIIHLAVANNNVDLDYESYFEANVNLYKNILNFAFQNNVKRVINLSTLHIFTSKKNHYTRTKKLALEQENNFKELEINNIFCPIIYGKKFNGKLKVLNSFPKFFKKSAFKLVSSLSPVVNIKNVANCINELISSSTKNHNNIYISDDKNKNIFFNIFKKFIDLSFVLTVILLFWWLIILIFCIIKLTSNGPAIFIQTRIGKNGKPFACYKFRTMNIGTENIATHEVNKNSITKVGKFLRASKLDELPQVMNIIKSELSLVGPRPGLPGQSELYEVRKMRNVFKVLPGITGLSQINNIDMSTPEKLAEWDDRYISMKSIPFEIKILVRTFFGQGSGDKVR